MKKQLTLLLAASLATVSLHAQEITQQDRDRAQKLVSQMTLPEKCDYLSGVNEFYIRAVPRLDIPAIRMADGPQGVRNNTFSTLFPCGIASAASWDRTAVRNMGRGMGQDARARGIHVMLGPAVNIYRSPLCGRNFEYFGEDPYLSGETAVSYISGMQSEGVMATIKHFACNNEEWDRNHTSSDVDERTLHEIYLPAFYAAIKKAHVGAVMSSYNPLNGVHTGEHPHLAIEILRNQWGFEGIYMSDWNGTYSTHGSANGGLDLEMPGGLYMTAEKLLPLVESGVVSECTIDEKCQHILQTLSAFGFLDREQKDPSIAENNPFSDQAALDLARSAIVLLKNDDGILPLKKGRIVVAGPNANRISMGGGSGIVKPIVKTTVFDGMSAQGRGYKILRGADPVMYANGGPAELFTDSSCKQPGLKGEYYTALEFAGEPALVRIDNGVLFDWIGEAPAAGVPENNFSARWTGVLVPKGSGTLKFRVSGDDGYRMFLDGKEIVSDWTQHAPSMKTAQVEVEAGKQYDFRMEYFELGGDASVSAEYCIPELDAWKARVEGADAVVYCAGFDKITEGEGFDRPFTLPEDQITEITEITKYNKNIVVVVNSGGGVDLTPLEGKVKAILMAWYPGQRGGAAVAEILTGKITPSGRLPISIERRAEDNPAFESYYENIPRHGSPYGRICYKEGVFVGYRGYDRTGTEPLYPFGYGLSYTQFAYSDLNIADRDGRCIVTFNVKNTGGYDGAEVAQVYVGEVKPNLPRPAKELKSYEKIFLKKGEQKQVTIELDGEAFAHYNTDAEKFVTTPGEYTVLVGASSKDIRLTGKTVR